jgi:ubiquinone/menaquinone biosynthesis C-methylase UbiE
MIIGALITCPPGRASPARRPEKVPNSRHGTGQLRQPAKRFCQGNEIPPMSASHETLVQDQFDRQVGHYLASSAMADQGMIRAILTAAPIRPGQRVLDVACGAGFLLRAYRQAGAEVWGADLSAAMLRAAGMTLGASVSPHHLVQADAARLPFDPDSFDLVTCKLALHYFRDPCQGIREMARTCRRPGRVALIDRVAWDDPERCAAQNRLEMLRTPNKVRVYTEQELAGMLASTGLTVVRRDLTMQPMELEEWMAAAGALDRLEQARALLIGVGGEDRTGLAPRVEAGRMMIYHRTLILVASPPSPSP